MSADKKNLPIYSRPAEILQRLIRFDTTNPPGNEIECITYIRGLLKDAGIQVKTPALDPKRPNLVARLSGGGMAAPLLMYGHADVVTTANQEWNHPPFSGEEAGGFIWGRGALDMKGGLSMMIAALLRAKAEDPSLPGDVVLAVVSDEEALGECGATYLVEKHPELFENIRYAIGEFGGFSMRLRGHRFYPIQVAEKQVCWMKATVKGPGGHGSMPVRGGAMAKLSHLLDQIDKRHLPVHITPVSRQMIQTIASSLGGMSGIVLGRLTNPLFTNRIIKLLGKQGSWFDPLLHNTVSPTVLHGVDKVNVIPSEVSVELDGRLLPGYGPDDLISELRGFIDEEVEIELIRYDQGPAEPDMGLFDTLAGILKETDPEGIPVPLILSATTDARLFSRLGIQTYGFLPMKLPEDFNFIATIHSADERIPVEAVNFGAQAIYTLLKRFGS